MSELWTGAEMAEVLGAGYDVGGVSIDTRTLLPGYLFVALAGVRDGHEFVQTARDKGAAACLVTRAQGVGFEIVVPDTLAALEALGRAARDRAPARRAAVTGSVGKTSVTQAIAAGLHLAGRAHSSVKSYNNHIGVPLTLARMRRETERAVFEIGMNHAGEIGPLSRMVQPHVAVITAVGPVHVENFPDGETGIANAKAEIFEGMAPGAAAVLNADSPWFDLLAGRAKDRGLRVISFGAKAGCDARLEGFTATGEGAVVGARLHGRDLSFRIAQSGAHWGLNSLAALLVMEALGVSLEMGMAALADFAPLEGRGAVRSIETAEGPFILVDESYNANPLSMRAAFATLAGRHAAGRRIVVLTDMLELGPEGPMHHADLAGPIEAAGVDLVFAAGPLMHSLWEALPLALRGAYADNAAALAPAVLAAVRAGDVVMVKGSNGSKASLVARALTDLGSTSGGAAPASETR